MTESAVNVLKKTSQTQCAEALLFRTTPAPKPGGHLHLLKKEENCIMGKVR